VVGHHHVDGRRRDAADLDRLTDAIHRLCDLLEQVGVQGLGGQGKARYTPGAASMAANLVDEMTMAAQLGIPAKTLADYRREGRLPKCWIRNGKRVLWRVKETVTAWENGIS